MCYHLTIKILYLYKRSSPDIQLHVSFLRTRVIPLDLHNWNKLDKTLQYMAFTKDLPLTLQDLIVQVIKWYIDAPFAVHGDMRSHTGGLITTGKVSVCDTSVCQKFNTKILTKDELVVVSNVLLQVICTGYFLEYQ